MKIKQLWLPILLLGLVLTYSQIILPNIHGETLGATTNQQEMPQTTIDQLAQYDGQDPNKPIYLAMDGLVYDVTEGKKFYQIGGSYHDLAGKDSSVDLHIAGGSIIKNKYPVIARLVEN